jgi:hypothetical protein
MELSRLATAVAYWVHPPTLANDWSISAGAAATRRADRVPRLDSIMGTKAEAASRRETLTSRRHEVPSRFDTPVGMLDT